MLRFHCENISTGRLYLDRTEAHHLIHVMRPNLGDKIELFDGSGTIGCAVIAELKRKDVIVDVKEVQTISPRRTGRVIIAASVAKGQRFDWLITKCTELGAEVIAPVIFERTVKLAKGKNSSERFCKLAVSAAKQCGRNFLPNINEPVQLADAVKTLQGSYPQAIMLYGGLSENAKRFKDIIQKDKDVVAFVGPEGGLTENEQELLKNADAIEAKLTKTILRIETAAVAFASILCAARDNS
ncbi:MAG: 16S rRNA (uracil(1498)-N(3))-methyltransferase [Sedimentisphaerales bacterium]|nr:16S rRNA (uracil(1498)-N(3))-methyltransferase [Sedimentisphaerales bacterium]